MRIKQLVSLFILCSSWLALPMLAADKVAEENTAPENQELPKILYVIPWKDMENGKSVDQKLVLHDLFVDIYEPVLPFSETAESAEDDASPTQEK